MHMKCRYVLDGTNNLSMGFGRFWSWKTWFPMCIGSFDCWECVKSAVDIFCYEVIINSGYRFHIHWHKRSNPSKYQRFTKFLNFLSYLSYFKIFHLQAICHVFGLCLLFVSGGCGLNCTTCRNLKTLYFFSFCCPAKDHYECNPNRWKIVKYNGAECWNFAEDTC